MPLIVFETEMQLVQQLTTPRTLSPEARLRYWTQLQDLDAEVFVSAVARYLRDQKYFPTIADIRREARSLAAAAHRVPTPAIAWRDFLDFIRKPAMFRTGTDPELHPVIDRTVHRLGGEDEIKPYLTSGNDRTESYIRTRFSQTYLKVAIDFTDWAATRPLPTEEPLYRPQLVNLETDLFNVS